MEPTKLIETGTKVAKHAKYVKFQCAEEALSGTLFAVVVNKSVVYNLYFPPYFGQFSG